MPISTITYAGTTGVITSGTVVNSTSGTSIDFTGIPSWVKRITVMFQGVSTNGTSLPQIQIGTSGGIQTTSYASGSWIANTTNSNSTTGFIFTASKSSNFTIDGNMTLCLLNSATGLWVFSGVVGSALNGLNAISGGSKTLSGTLDRVRITTVNGTDVFNGGSINILYE